MALADVAYEVRDGQAGDAYEDALVNLLVRLKVLQRDLLRHLMGVRRGSGGDLSVKSRRP
eukprot:3029194-Pyramimonas_sp.AAC.1